MQDVAEVKGLTEAPVADAAAPAQTLPACPHCGQDPAKLNVMFQSFPKGQIASIVFCGNPECRKIFSAQIVGMAAETTPGGIIKPPVPRI